MAQARDRIASTSTRRGKRREQIDQSYRATQLFLKGNSYNCHRTCFLDNGPSLCTSCKTCATFSLRLDSGSTLTEAITGFLSISEVTTTSRVLGRKEVNDSSADNYILIPTKRTKPRAQEQQQNKTPVPKKRESPAYEMISLLLLG